MNPVAFEIFGIPVAWYGILITTGILFGTYLAVRECRRISFNEDKLIDLLIFAIPSAIIGARLYYVIFMWDLYKNDLSQILNVRGGGLAIHGAIIGAVASALIYCKIRKVNFWTVADITAPSLILGQAIGRWGNYINQEAHGGPTNLPWGIMVNGVKVHPTFLYESLWNFGVFIFLMWYKKKSNVKGELFLLYIALYSFARFLIEGLRTDSLMLGNFRVAQIISAIIIFCSLSVLYLKKKRENDIVKKM